MQGYLKPINLELSVKERQYLFQCRVNDIDIRSNRTWKYKELFCMTCKDSYIMETGRHILVCKLLIEKNYKITYLPEHNDLYSEDIQDQIYTSNMTLEHMKIRKTLNEAQDN